MTRHLAAIGVVLSALAGVLLLVTAWATPLAYNVSDANTGAAIAVYTRAAALGIVACGFLLIAILCILLARHEGAP